MRTTPRPKPIRETPEIHLVDSVKYLDDCPLNDLVLQRGDPERPQPPVRLRYVRPPRGRRPVASRLHPPVQVPEARLQVLPVAGPRHPVHPRCGLRADRPIRLPEPVQRDVVQQRGEPCFPCLVLPPHAHDPAHWTHRFRRCVRDAFCCPCSPWLAPFPPPPPQAMALFGGFAG